MPDTTIWLDFILALISSYVYDLLKEEIIMNVFNLALPVLLLFFCGAVG